MEELINAYKELNIEDKRHELGEEFIEFLGIIHKLRNDLEIPTLLNSSPVRKLYDVNSSEDEYLTGVYENVLNLKEELAVYLEKIADALYE